MPFRSRNFASQFHPFPRVSIEIFIKRTHFGARFCNFSDAGFPLIPILGFPSFFISQKQFGRRLQSGRYPNLNYPHRFVSTNPFDTTTVKPQTSYIPIHIKPQNFVLYLFFSYRIESIALFY